MNSVDWLMNKEARIPWGGLAKYVAAPAALIYGLSHAWGMTQKNRNSLWDQQFVNTEGPTHVREGQTVYHDPNDWNGQAGTTRSYLQAYTPEEQESLYSKGITRYRHSYEPTPEMLDQMKTVRRDNAISRLMEGPSKSIEWGDR